MKTFTIIILGVCISLLAASPRLASAEFSGRACSMPVTWLPAGLFQHTQAPISVEQARLAQPESPVIIRGNIQQFVGNNLYVFADKSSSVLIAIPEGIWDGLDISPRNLVEIHGEVRRSPHNVKISVAKIIKVQ